MELTAEDLRGLLQHGLGLRVGREEAGRVVGIVELDGDRRSRARVTSKGLVVAVGRPPPRGLERIGVADLIEDRPRESGDAARRPSR